MTPHDYDPSGYDPSRAGSFEIPDTGPCRVFIEDATEKRSQAGNLMFELVAKVLEGQKGAGSRMWEYIVLEGSGAELADSKIGAIFDSCGVDPSLRRRVSAKSFIGLTGTVEVKHETRDGQTRARIAWWKRSDGPKVASPDAAPNADPPPEYDDIPF